MRLSDKFGMNFTLNTQFYTQKKFIPLSDLGSLLQHFFSEITISPEYLLLFSVVFEKINNFDFYSKNVFFFNRKKFFTRSET